MSKFNIGAKVVFSRLAESVFGKYKYKEGVVTSVKYHGKVAILRGPMKKAEVWHVGYWRKCK